MCVLQLLQGQGPSNLISFVTDVLLDELDTSVVRYVGIFVIRIDPQPRSEGTKVTLQLLVG